MKKLFSFLLLFCVFICAMGSCVSNDGDTAATTATTAENEVTTASTTTATTTAEIPAEPTPVVYNDEELYVGFAKENISPKDADGNVWQVPLGGYADLRVNQGVVSQAELYAICTAFRDAQGDIALIYSVDNLHFSTWFASYFRGEISKATGVLSRNIVLNTTHCHSAPAIETTSAYPDTFKYKEKVHTALINAAKSAIEDLSLCTELYVGNVEIDGLNFIRRYVTDANGNLVHESEPDPYMPVAKFVREGKKDIILANWAAHTDTVTRTHKYVSSADYIGFFRNEVENRLDANVSFHLAASGDVNPISKIPGEYTFPGTRNYGKAVAAKLISQINTLERVEIKSDVRSKAALLKLEVNHTTDHLLDKAKEVRELYYSGDKARFEAKRQEYGFENVYEANGIINRASLGATEDMNVSVVSIGNIAFGVAPYEMFAYNGKNIKAASDFDLTFVCAYSNGSYGYIASGYAYENGNYEVYSCRYVKGSAEILQDKIISLMAELYK